MYAFGAGADLDPTNINLSGLDATNDFSSPDGLWFSLPSNVAGQQQTPVMWIQTDDGAFTDVTNCMMLAAIPGRVGDGGTRSVTSSAAGERDRHHAVGKAPGVTLKRFLVVRSSARSPHPFDAGRYLGVRQHPASGRGRQQPGRADQQLARQPGWSASATIRPRSATIVITKNDGGVVAI